MKRASFSAALIFCGAAIFGWIFPKVLLPLGVTALLLGIVFLILFLIFRTVLLRDLLFCAVSLVLSVTVLWFPITDYYDTVELYDDVTVTATVTLTEDPVLSSSGVYRYTVRPSRELFSQKFIFFSSVYYTDGGGSIRGTFTFSRPEEEYAFSSLSDGVALTAVLETSEEEIEVTDPRFSFDTVSEKVRRYVHRTCLEFLGKDNGGFMAAALTGDKDLLSPKAYGALSQTGMLHIVAVSGLHVSIFVSFVLFFLQKVRRLRLRLALSILSLLVIFLFAGFTPSVCRAVIMNGVLFLHQGISIGSDPFNRLGISAIVILLVSPYAVWSLSFQLSFAAALGILLFAKAFQQGITQWLFVSLHLICGSVLRSVVSLFSVSLSAFVLTLPILWIRLNSYSVWSILLSFTVLPVLEVCFFGVLILLILNLFSFQEPLCGFLGAILRYGVTYMTNLTMFASSLMGSAENLSPLLKWVIGGVLLIAAVVLFFFPSKKTNSKRKKKHMIRRGIALVLLAVSLLTAYQAADHFGESVGEGEVAPQEGVLQTAFLDVGQGNCFVSVLDGEAYVVDCGGTKKAGFVASDYLTSVGVETVRFVLISHLHDDHANGLEDLCAEKTILEIIIPFTEGDASLYAKITSLAATEGAKLTVLESDAKQTLGGSTLHMFTKHLDPTSDDQNENSIVGVCEYGNYRVMFTGDITSAAEKRLVSAYGSDLDCDVLSVPHHGSKGSSCKEFLRATSPVYAVVSVGAKNSYGHPTKEALQRIANQGAESLRTDELSTIVIRSDGKMMEVVSPHES